MLSYLPLAHSYERAWVEAASLVDGHTHVYFAESLDTFLQDLQRARPTLFISVPRLWLKFQQGVFAKMPPAKLDRLLGIPILGRIVARKVLKGLGLDAGAAGRQRLGADPGRADPLVPAPGPGAVRGLCDDRGLRLFAHLQRAVRRAGLGGRAAARRGGAAGPQGEILIKSPGQFSGYYKQPELTAASFTEDGFFRTGDLGERRADGMLKITGRAKELFKTAKGKYVAPAPIENRINVHPLVELSLVSGVGQPAAYAIVVLAEDLRPRVGDPAVRAQVQASSSVCSTP